MTDSSAHDRAAFERLLSQTAWLQRCALRMGYRSESAEDAVQETLLMASQAQALRPGPGWLRRTLQRRLGMQLRSERRRAQRERELARPEAQELDPASVLEQLEFQQELQRAVAQLPRRDREVLALRFVANVSVQEIAQSLGQTPNAVSTRLSRTLQRLRVMLDPDSDPRSSSRRFAWLPLPVAGFLRRAASPFGAAGAHLPTPFVAGLALLMKNTSLTLVVLTLVTLGSLALWNNTPAGDPLQDRSSAADGHDNLSPELESGLQLDQQQHPALSEARTAVRNPGEQPEPELVADAQTAVTGAIRVVCLETGSTIPAQGIDVELLLKNRGVIAWNRTEVRRTNEQGEAFFDAVEPGISSVVLSRFGSPRGRHSGRATVRAGETATVQLEVDPQQAVGGIVVDESGQAVADAELWIGHRPGPVKTGYLVGKSGPRGRFSLKYVGSEQFICARANGYAPSLSASASFATGYAERGLRLELGSGRGTLRGTVRCPAGEFLPGVLVSIGEMIAPAPGPGFYWTPIPQWRKTDAEGGFEFADVGLGETRVHARHHDFAPWSGHVWVTDGRPVELAIELSGGGTLVGQVRTAHGSPAPAARIAAYNNEGDSQPQVETRADEEGRFRLSGIGAGERFLEVQSENERTGARESVYVADGVEQAWNPVLSLALNLEGFVVSESGAPLAGWYVAAFSITDGIQAANSSGVFVRSDGSFSVQPAPGEEFTLRVYPPGRFLGPEALVLESHVPREETLTMVVPQSQVPSASLQGQLIDAEGNPLAGQVRLRVATQPATNLQQATTPEGRFHFSYLPEGSFLLTLESRGYESREQTSVGELVPAEERDLGPQPLQKL